MRAREQELPDTESLFRAKLCLQVISFKEHYYWVRCEAVLTSNLRDTPKIPGRISISIE